MVSLEYFKGKTIYFPGAGPHMEDYTLNFKVVEVLSQRFILKYIGVSSDSSNMLKASNETLYKYATFQCVPRYVFDKMRATGDTICILESRLSGTYLFN